MTEEAKEILIEKMLDRQVELTDDDIAAIIGDEEMSELYEISVGLAAQLRPQPKTSADEGWNELRRRLTPNKRLSAKRYRIISGVAAAACLFLMVGLALRFAFNSEITMDTRGCDTMPGSEIAEAKVAVIDNVAEEDVVEIDSNQPSTAPDDKTDMIDIDEYLRIEQARIDNDVAMAMARVYKAQYDAYIEVLADMLAGGDVADVDPLIRDLTTMDIDKVIML